jgi:hypothetical protein
MIPLSRWDMKLDETNSVFNDNKVFRVCQQWFALAIIAILVFSRTFFLPHRLQSSHHGTTEAELFSAVLLQPANGTIVKSPCVSTLSGTPRLLR